MPMRSSRSTLTADCAPDGFSSRHKIGLTSEPMQTLLGVDEPDFGYILDDMVVPDGATVPATASARPASNRKWLSCFAIRYAGRM